MPLADVIYRIATDAPFAAQIQCDSAATLAAAGLNKEDSGTEALLAVLHSNPNWEELCSTRLIGLSRVEWWLAQFDPQTQLVMPSSIG